MSNEPKSVPSAKPAVAAYALHDVKIKRRTGPRAPEVGTLAAGLHARLGVAEAREARYVFVDGYFALYNFFHTPACQGT